jgi:hypothetical protein
LYIVLKAFDGGEAGGEAGGEVAGGGIRLTVLQLMDELNAKVLL